MSVLRGGAVRYNVGMITIQKHDTGAGVEDVQQKLAALGFLAKDQVSATFDDATVAAVAAFCRENDIEAKGVVTEKVWAALVDASFCLGDRTLYLRMPYFHGNDVAQLQTILGALGFACGADDHIFGAYTELALRKFQLNLGLPSDGIAGALTYAAINSLHHSWEGKRPSQLAPHLGFARAADVLETNALCLFGTDEFTRSVASRMSNLALATNPASKIISADSLSATPGKDMLLVHIVLPDQPTPLSVPRVLCQEEETLALRLRSALESITLTPPRIILQLPSAMWEDAGAGRSAQHFAIMLLDALCASLAVSD
ncbi:MAG: peptidoglycan-binding domain-containing protein [Eggerthellaceae bacterium]